jgi:hypothetical protein
VCFVYIWISIFEIPIIYVYLVSIQRHESGTLKERILFSDRASESSNGLAQTKDGRTNFRNGDEIATSSVHRSARIDQYDSSAGTKWKVLKPYSDQAEILRLQLFS